MKKGKKVDQAALLREWYKPTKRGAEARRLLEMDHEAMFGR